MLRRALSQWLAPRSTPPLQRWLSTAPPEQLNYDVVVVGAGPAGLAAAIRFKQLCATEQRALSVCVLEKGSSVGAHTLSGCVMDPKALDELLPGWRDEAGGPTKVSAGPDQLLLLTHSSSYRLPVPRCAAQQGQLRPQPQPAPPALPCPEAPGPPPWWALRSEVVRWLGLKAEALGVDVLPGFAAARLLLDSQGGVAGVATPDTGLDKRGRPKPGFSAGVEVRAAVTLLAEGARGSLSQEVIRRFDLRAKAGADPQTYALGIKEVWEVPEGQAQPGLVLHSLGWPLDAAHYGGGFLYHMADRKVAAGLVVGLDYTNPYLSPFQEFQRWKRHPAIARHLQGGTVLQYGARVLNEGGFQSIPQLNFPGGALLGCAAGFLNAARIKGTHTAINSAPPPPPLAAPVCCLQVSWLWGELAGVRNVRPGFRWGLLPGLAHAALDQVLLRGKAWWTLHHRRGDHEGLRAARDCRAPEYPPPDGALTFDLPTSLYRSGTNHEHDQPSHLRLRDPGVPEFLNGPHYAGPEARYCPAGVYEYSRDENQRLRLQINAQNCLHCKACDVKGQAPWLEPGAVLGPALAPARAVLCSCPLATGTRAWLQAPAAGRCLLALPAAPPPQCYAPPLTLASRWEDEEEFDGVAGEVLLPKRLLLLALPPAPGEQQQQLAPAVELVAQALGGAAPDAGFTATQVSGAAAWLWQRLGAGGPPLFRKMRERPALGHTQVLAEGADCPVLSGLLGELLGQNWRVELDYGLGGAHSLTPREVLLLVAPSPTVQQLVALIAHQYPGDPQPLALGAEGTPEAAHLVQVDVQGWNLAGGDCSGSKAPAAPLPPTPGSVRGRQAGQGPPGGASRPQGTEEHCTQRPGPLAGQAGAAHSPEPGGPQPGQSLAELPPVDAVLCWRHHGAQHSPSTPQVLGNWRQLQPRVTALRARTLGAVQ
ncbi:hypothetical protein QJQ45_015277 [Haematococcus lacustris]|nr:hypothetical protein QJQ45_015277 [Haematococcus lacustris]